MRPWLALLTLCTLLVLVLACYLPSDWSWRRQMIDHNWRFVREIDMPVSLSNLLLDENLSRWQEDGRMLMLDNGQWQFESRLRIGKTSEAPSLRVLVRGQWALSHKYLAFTPSDISLMPDNQAGKALLGRRHEALQTLMRDHFLRIRQVETVDSHQLLLDEPDGGLWLLLGT